jgi:hypothetical protein
VGIDDSIMVKRIEKHPGKLVLRSDNKVYEPIYLSPNEMDSFRIIGKVVWVSRDVQQFADGYYLNFTRVLKAFILIFMQDSGITRWQTRSRL